MGQMTLGLVVPYSPEYRAGGVNRGLLAELARITGGGFLAEPVNAFLHNLPAANSAREIWRTLLFIAALLFPLDVALRRIMFSKRDMQTARAWVNAHLPGRPLESQGRKEPVVLSQLFGAKERARLRTSAKPVDDPSKAENRPADRAEPGPANEEAPAAKDTDVPAQSSTQDSMARLREAKKRAKR